MNVFFFSCRRFKFVTLRLGHRNVNVVPVAMNEAVSNSPLGQFAGAKLAIQYLPLRVITTSLNVTSMSPFYEFPYIYLRPAVRVSNLGGSSPWKKKTLLRHPSSCVWRECPYPQHPKKKLQNFSSQRLTAEMHGWPLRARCFSLYIPDAQPESASVLVVNSTSLLPEEVFMSHALRRHVSHDLHGQQFHRPWDEVKESTLVSVPNTCHVNSNGWQLISHPNTWPTTQLTSKPRQVRHG